MVNRMNRQRVRKRRGGAPNSKMKFAVIIGIMIMAVFLGYLTARFVIGPVLGYNADESPITAGADEAETAESDDEEKGTQTGEEDSKETAAPEEGYALQFGVFSTKEAANKMASELLAKGIETEIVQTDGMYKVISPVIKTKDEALQQLENIKEKEIEDVFIASF